MATYKQLIAHRLDIEGIRQQIGADSLDYLSLPGMIEAVQSGASEGLVIAAEEQTHGRGHLIGRVRLSATTAPPRGLRK